MLKKLFKYEWKATGRVFGLCYVGVLAAAVLMRILTTAAWQSEGALLRLLPEDVGDWLAGLSIAAYAVMVAAVFAVTFILILLRFYRNLLGGEGYLMHTLPVTSRQLILSKLLAAMVWTVLSCVVVLVSITILVMSPDILQTLPEEWRLLMEYRTQIHVSNGVIFGEALLVALYLLAALAGGILKLYAAMMLGHQAAKHKIALSVGAYFGINAALSAVFVILINVFSRAAGVVPFIQRALDGHCEDALFSFTVILGLAVLYNLVLSGIFYGITNYLMSRRLNLE